MTISEQRVLMTLKEFISSNGYVPTIRELGAELGLSSPATVHYYLKQLELKGYLKRINNRKYEIKEVEEW